MVTLSPMSVAPVCRVGDPLQITCTASVQFIRRNIMVVNDQGMEEDITVSSNESRDPSPPPRERIPNSTRFTFSRISPEDYLPLITTQAIISTSIGLNGTVVHCVDAINPMTSASTTIKIIDTSNSKLLAIYFIRRCYFTGIILSVDLDVPDLKTISKEFGADNVTVTVEWTQQAAVMYTPRIVPLDLIMSFPIGSSSQQIQLILSYDISYNFSIEASAPCKPIVTGFIELYYGEEIIPVHSPYLIVH